MTYIPDLTPYAPLGTMTPDGTLSIGWLDSSHEFNQGHVPSEFLDKLWSFCSVPVMLSRGFHLCNLCSPIGDRPVLAKHGADGADKLVLGSREIRVFGGGANVYASPDLIYHYVSEHRYMPPDEFIRAVVGHADPKSRAYRDMLAERIGVSPAEPLHELVVVRGLGDMRRLNEARRQRKPADQ